MISKLRERSSPVVVPGSPVAQVVETMLSHGIGLSAAVTMFRDAVICGALVRMDGNKSRAARALGVNRNTVARYTGWFPIAEGAGKRRRQDGNTRIATKDATRTA